jgi:hypothetical protein
MTIMKQSTMSCHPTLATGIHPAKKNPNLFNAMSSKLPDTAKNETESSSPAVQSSTSVAKKR